MTRWAFIVGPGRSGTTLLRHLLNRSPLVYVAPETKYFQQVWSQRHLLRMLPRDLRLECIADHLVASEYPADPPTFPRHRSDFVATLRTAATLEEGFPALLQTLSDRPVLGEKTPWHTFFVDQISRAAPGSRFVAITRDAPAAVASTWERSGFRRVETLTRCIARWIFMNREVLSLRERLEGDSFHLVRFEDLVSDPEPVLRGVCDFLDLPWEPAMLTPTLQDSSLRTEETGDGGFDVGALVRWRERLARNDLRRIRAHTWEISRRLGYAAEPAEAGLQERASVAMELTILQAAVLLMRSGFYPFGPAGRLFHRKSP